MCVSLVQIDVPHEGAKAPDRGCKKIEDENVLYPCQGTPKGDKEYQGMRDAAIRVIREVGVETGGSNIQFAVNPENGRMVIIEMNPRVSRSSALASKATGFPIAKIAAKLAIGYTLDEISNDITRETPACFEPTIDYCVVKIPRFNFEKFPGIKGILTTSMQSVGEVMAIGRTFKEALHKALRSLETGVFGFVSGKETVVGPVQLEKKLVTPTVERLFYIGYALSKGMSIEKIHRLTWIDPWFLHNIKEIVDLAKKIALIQRYHPSSSLSHLSAELLRQAKEYGFSDHELACLLGTNETSVRNLRKKMKIEPVFKLVDTCAAEFEAYTPYYYSTYEREDESR